LLMEKIDMRPFGHTETAVTIAGLGGEGVLRTYGRDIPAAAVIMEALQQGIGYYDCAHVYADSERYYGAVWGRNPEKRQKIFQASKSASRDKKGALADLEKTLGRMRTDYLDLWQIHDVRTEKDLEEISGPGGALEAFVEAKDAGRVRYIGVTGHHAPNVLTRAVEQWPVDAVMMPINPVEEILGGFTTATLPAARNKGLAIIGMKILGAAHFIQPAQGITASLLIRYALSQEITVGIVGCASAAEVEILSGIGQRFQPLSPEEKQRLIAVFRPYARRLAYYRGEI